ncbi:hypothetical protein Tco_0771380 [Tanacetum coccineum]|uniref:Uncharacterized protein n=1 Tax=Tanacetum coccineum TaxID=301880 RepID=A0ABQ4ZEX3_9ASTR
MLSLHITAKVAGKSVSISEASIRSDLLFDDADGIDSLPNQAIFDAIQLMGSKSTSWDQIPTNIATAVICLTSNQKHNFSKLIFDGRITPLFATMLVQPTQDGGVSLERPTEAQPTPSPAPTSEVPHEPQPDSSSVHIKTSGRNLGGHSSSDKSLSRTEGEMTLQSVYDLCLSLCAQLRRKKENAQDVGRTREIVDEEKEIDENILSTKDVLSTDKDKVSTDKEKVSTDRPIVSTDGSKSVKDTEKLTDLGLFLQESFYIKPLPKIDPIDKRKKKIEEEDKSESESDGIPEAEKKFKQLARIEADRLLAEKLQEQEREQFTIEERAKFLHDTIDAQRKFLAQQRSEAIRNRPPTKNQLRNQMMTYLKHVGNFKALLKCDTKKFEEIQALYEKIKRSDEDFISIGSAEDERLIKRMNEKGIDSSKSEVINEESKEEAKEESKEEESTRKKKLGTRKKMKSRKRRFIQNTSEDDSEKENDELRLHLTKAPDEEKEVDYEILDRKYPIKERKTECLGTKPQVDKAKHIEEINQNVVIRSNGKKRYFRNLDESVLNIFDRDDFELLLSTG